jgi:hypothetical protein
MTSVEVGDPTTYKLRILSERCATCILRPPGERIRLSNDRIREFVNDAIGRDSYIVCHSTLPGAAPDGVLPAICRGFADAYSTNALRMGERLLGFVEVDPPTGSQP